MSVEKESNKKSEPEQENLNLYNFLREENSHNRYVLTSPRSIHACKIIGVRPVDLLPRSLSQVEQDLIKHNQNKLDSPSYDTAEGVDPSTKLSPEICQTVWRELEREREENLDLARRERDRIIIDTYHSKHQEGNSPSRNNGTRYHSIPDLQYTPEKGSMFPATRSLTVSNPLTETNRVKTPTIMKQKRKYETSANTSSIDNASQYEYTTALKKYWNSLWHDEQRKCHEQQTRNLANLHCLHKSRVSPTPTILPGASELESARESLERDMMEWRKKFEEKKKKNRDRIKQTITDSSNKIASNYTQTVVVSPIQQHSERPYSALSPEQYSQQQLTKMSSRNAAWTSKSRLAQLTTEENTLRNQEVNKILLDDKMNKSEFRQTIAREQQREVSLFRSEKNSLKKFHQELSLQQQETDQQEWKNSVSQKQQLLSHTAQYLRNRRLDDVKERLYQQRKNKIKMQQNNLDKVNKLENERLEYVENRINIKEKRNDSILREKEIFYKECQKLSHNTERMRRSFKELCGRNNFNTLARSAEMYNNLGKGPRCSTLNHSHVKLLS